MYSLRQFTTILLLALAALNVVVGKGPETSQCRRWYDNQQKADSVVAASPQVKLLEKVNIASQSTALMRRITPSKGSFYVDGGLSACGTQYNTDDVVGVCLWAGGKKPAPQGTYAGWVNGAHRDNCKKNVWIYYGDKQNISAEVIDACPQNLDNEDEGCRNLYVTKKLFLKLGGNVDKGSVVVPQWGIYTNAALT